MTFLIEYHPKVVAEDIPDLSSAMKRRIHAAIEEKLMIAPELFGKPLRRSLAGYRKLRVGDYRVIFRIDLKKIKILIIQHRSIIYKLVSNRQ